MRSPPPVVETPLFCTQLSLWFSPFLSPLPYLLFILPHFCPRHATHPVDRRVHSRGIRLRRVELFAERHERRDRCSAICIAFRLSCTNCNVNPFARNPSESQRESSSTTVATYNHNDRHRRADDARARNYKSRTLRGYRMMDKLDEIGAGDADGEGGVGWLVNRSNAGCCSRVQVLARGEWISIVSTPSLQATGNRG